MARRKYDAVAKEATPLPWTVGTGWTSGPKRQVICEVPGYPYGTKEADNALIAHRNTHFDALRKSLSRCLAIMGEDTQYQDLYKDGIAAIRAADTVEII